MLLSAPVSRPFLSLSLSPRSISDFLSWLLSIATCWPDNTTPGNCFGCCGTAATDAILLPRTSPLAIDTEVIGGEGLEGMEEVLGRRTAVWCGGGVDGIFSLLVGETGGDGRGRGDSRRDASVGVVLTTLPDEVSPSSAADLAVLDTYGFTGGPSGG